MLNIKTIKKLLMLAVALVMLFTAAFFCCNTNLAALAQGEPTAEEVDDYLRDNGYSEEFIAQAGPETKLNLYQSGAEFESDSTVSQQNMISLASADDDNYGEDTSSPMTGPWEGFTGTLTVSDLSSGNLSKKILTFTWEWNSVFFVSDDAIVLMWDRGYNVLLDSALFEVSGDWNKVSQVNVVPGFPDPPDVLYNVQYEELTKRGLDAILYDEMRPDGTALSYSASVGAGFVFSIFSDPNDAIRVDYGTGVYAFYQFDATTINGSYSVTIALETEDNNPTHAGVYYLHKAKAIDFNIKFTITGGVTLYPEVAFWFSFSIDPDIDIYDYYQRSSFGFTEFNTFNEPSFID